LLTFTINGVTANIYEFRIYKVTGTAQTGYKQSITAVSSSNMNVTIPVYILATAKDTKIVIQVRNISDSNKVFLLNCQYDISMIHN